MHIQNAVLDPRVAVATSLLGAAGLGYALRVLEKKHGERTIVLMGTMSAFVFAAQMVNFPVGPCTGHLLGGTLAAVMLGPWAGAIVIAAVLIVQCLLFGDGGLTALGSNFVNMGLIGSVLGYAIYAPIRRSIGGNRGILIGAMAAAWFSVVLASGAFSIELAATGTRHHFVNVLGWMSLVHAGIGIGEALITGLFLKFILETRPDLVYDPEPTTERAARTAGWTQTAVAGLGIALAIAIFVAPFKAEAPDGLEYVGTQKFDFIKEDAPSSLPTPIPDYELPALIQHSPKLATAAAGAIGTVVVFGLSLMVAGVFSRRGAWIPALRAPEKVSSDAV